MAIEMDEIGSADNSELEHDDADSQNERLFLILSIDMRTDRILTGKVYKDRHMKLRVSYMLTASRLCRSHRVCKRCERLTGVSSVKSTEDSA